MQTEYFLNANIEIYVMILFFVAVVTGYYHCEYWDSVEFANYDNNLDESFK